MKRALIVFSLIGLLLGCKDDESDSAMLPFIGKEYVSLKVGQDAVYQIDSTIYNEFTGRINLVSSQQREYISRTELDAANRKTFIVEIHTRTSDSLPWRLNRVTRRVLTDFRYEVLDDNVITVPLVFPIVEEEKWNSNVLNSNQAREFEYKEVNEAFVNGNLQYDSTLTVLQFEEENLIEQQLEQEIYAVNVGLIFRSHKNIETELNGDVRSGFEATIRLISFK